MSEATGGGPEQPQPGYNSKTQEVAHVEARGVHGAIQPGDAAALKAFRTQARRRRAPQLLCSLAPHRLRYAWYLLLIDYVLSRALHRHGGIVDALLLLAIVTYEMLAWLAAPGRKELSAADKLCESSGSWRVGALSEMLLYGFGTRRSDRDYARRAAAELKRLLPTLTEASRVEIDSFQRRVLLGALHRDDDLLSICILGSLHRIGDSAAVFYVERLASGEGSARLNDRIRVAAQDALPAMRSMNASHLNNSLLRTADRPDHRDALVRAANAATARSARESLRPADSGAPV
ncbi:MAG TPA: hypothetical protein VGS41_00065 [Chthonomonadales bacterium]|nr:hypothetical protein [Chthonomonadales bacterium]